MREVNSRAMRFAARSFLVGVLAFLGACLPASRAIAQGGLKSADVPDPPTNPQPGYSVNPDPTTVTISYKIKWDTGNSVPSLDKAAPDKGFKVTVNPQGARAPEGIVVTIYVKLEDGPEGKYTIGAAEKPIPRDAGTNDFTIDKPTMTTFATSLLTDALKVAPPAGKVGKIDVYKITATPVIAGAPSKVDGPEQTLDGKLVLTLKRVIGEL